MIRIGKYQLRYALQQLATGPAYTSDCDKTACDATPSWTAAHQHAAKSITVWTECESLEASVSLHVNGLRHLLAGVATTILPQIEHYVIAV